MVATASDTVNLHASSGVEEGSCAVSLAQLAARPLFGAIARHCAAFAQDGLPDLAALNVRLAQCRPLPRSVVGCPLCFVAPDSAELGYEQRVYRHGEVVTRPDNWHDFFNALVWLSFPRTKAALNALHVEHMAQAAGRAGRGPARDAATQFDESGIVVLSADPGLLDLLAQREWKALFWTQREQVVARMRFLVFGHGLYDALRNPFYRICGRAALIDVGPEIIERDAVALCAHADPILAQRFAAGACYPRPRALLALPLLGIPSVTPASEQASYYDDTEQFRPPPALLDSTLPPHRTA